MKYTDQKKLRIESIEKAIKRKEFCIEHTETINMKKVTAKWLREQERQLDVLKRMLAIVRKHRRSVYFTNDLRLEYILL